MTLARTIAACAILAVPPCSSPATAIAVAEVDSEALFARQRQQLAHSIRDYAVPIGERPDPRILRVVAEVPRHRFVPRSQRQYAYLDQPLPIGRDQTISQPSLVALMTHLLRPKPDHVVLEVGTGSGYQAALLARLVRHVYTIEIVGPLARQSQLRLAGLGYGNITVRHGDGYAGWPAHAPFDAIIVTAGAPHVPRPLVEQLRPGGRMVIPVGPAKSVQHLKLITKDDRGRIRQRLIVPVAFVPLTREVRD